MKVSSNDYRAQMDRVPVLFVHGWKSHPGIWKPVIREIAPFSISSWLFDHSAMTDDTIHEIIRKLEEFIRVKRSETGYKGEIDIVCHSMGSFLCRYLLEVMDGKEKKHQVRQLIMIGPPSNGSAMAEIFNHPTMGPEIIRMLAGVFVPKTYDPSEDYIVQGIRFTSRESEELRRAGVRTDIRYRTVVSVNRSGLDEFFPLFGGKTWVCSPDGCWMQTWFGDGIIPFADTRIPGTMWDLIGAQPHPDINPYEYCHILLPKNLEVVELTARYLHRPDIPCSHIWPDDHLDY